jgi:hypothetical protein
MRELTRKEGLRPLKPNLTLKADAPIPQNEAMRREIQNLLNSGDLYEGLEGGRVEGERRGVGLMRVTGSTADEMEYARNVLSTAPKIVRSSLGANPIMESTAATEPTPRPPKARAQRATAANPRASSRSVPRRRQAEGGSTRAAGISHASVAGEQATATREQIASTAGEISVDARAAPRSRGESATIIEDTERVAAASMVDSVVAESLARFVRGDNTGPRQLADDAAVRDPVVQIGPAAHVSRGQHQARDEQETRTGTTERF